MIFDLVCFAKVVSTIFSSQCAPWVHRVYSFMRHFLSACDYGAGRIAFPITVPARLSQPYLGQGPGPLLRIGQKKRQST